MYGVRSSPTEKLSYSRLFRADLDDWLLLKGFAGLLLIDVKGNLNHDRSLGQNSDSVGNRLAYGKVADHPHVIGAEHVPQIVEASLVHQRE